MSNLLFRNEPERTGKGLRFEIRKVSRKELDAEDAELAELIESDPEHTHKTATKSNDITPEAAAAFMKRYEQKQAREKAEDDRKAAVDGLAEALRKARGL